MCGARNGVPGHLVTTPVRHEPKRKRESFERGSIRPSPEAVSPAPHTTAMHASRRLVRFASGASRFADASARGCTRRFRSFSTLPPHVVRVIAARARPKISQDCHTGERLSSRARARRLSSDALDISCRAPLASAHRAPRLADRFRSVPNASRLAFATSPSPRPTSRASGPPCAVCSPRAGWTARASRPPDRSAPSRKATSSPRWVCARRRRARRASRSETTRRRRPLLGTRRRSRRRRRARARRPRTRSRTRP